AGDEVLEVPGHVGDARVRAMDMLVAEHRTSHGHALVPSLVVGGHQSSFPKKFLSRSATTAGCSALARCPASGTSTAAPSGAATASIAMASGGATGSSCPEIASNGVRSEPNSPVR